MTQLEDSTLSKFIEIRALNNDDFLKVKETLTRMGVPNKEKNVLYQSCHVLHKKGKYYIVLFKELFQLDGRETDITEEDYARRNTIAKSLEKWNMIKILNPEVCASPILGGRQGLTIIQFSEKSKWTLSPKYTMGKKKAV